MMRLLKITLVLLTVLTVPACAPQTFNYPKQTAGQSVKDLSFYQPLGGDGTLGNITGTEIRNVILCIGDGMGANHIAAARQEALDSGKRLTMERLPVTGMMRTHSANDAITDSAAAVTAMACGIKTDNGTIGMDPEGQPCKTILECLRQKGWRSGLVATSQISHATPAGFAAHVKNRGDQDKIALQMLENRVDVLFGGGAKYWQPWLGGRDLFEEAAQAGYQIARTKKQMNSLDNSPAVGLFADDGLTTYAPEPSLEEMSQKAIEMLSSKGQDWFAPQPRFFMMIEGSQIDWASHNNETDNMIRQTLLFDMAVRRAVQFAQKDRRTLVIVTADHETGGITLKPDASGTKKAVKWTSRGHTDANVPLFAFGPGSERFSGTLDNTQLAIRLAELTGVAPLPVMLSGKPAILPAAK